MSMRYARLGRSGPKVSRICLGTNNFGRQLDEEMSKAVVAKALDLGINIIDTANIYTDGKSEEIIGRALRGERGQVLIATKVGMQVGNEQGSGGLSREHIEAEVAKSLKRLCTDYIDLYYMHRFDTSVSLEETLRTMDALVLKGKVRHIGVSNFTPEQLDATMKICARHGLTEPVAVQPPYSLVAREPEKDLLPFCSRHGLGVLTYSPLWGGFLTGKYSRGAPPPEGSRGSASPRYLDRISDQGDFQKLEKLKAVAARAGVPLGQLAIAWILHNPAVTAPIVGASKPEQVAENCQIPEMKIDNKVFDELESAIA
ncbi:MAG TPA: aldo/keto reductase [Nitrososphaerales archaeon]|nr:aldo/keto reductase [Nitrososphaerales archaeon]